MKHSFPLFLTLAALCTACILPATTFHATPRTWEEPDTVVTDDEALMMEADTVASEDATWTDFEGTDYPEEASAEEEADSSIEPEVICPADDELLAEYNVKDADYNLQNKQNANTGVSFSANIFTPGEVKKQSGFNLMVCHILQATLPDGAQGKWAVANLDKMLENKWKAVKEAYQNDLQTLETNGEAAPRAEGGDIVLPSYSYHTSVMPVWKFAEAGGAVTYKVDDEVYLGGAHGMPYCYYLTLSEKTDSLLGLTDIFKEESLPAVFQLVASKLALRPPFADQLPAAELTSGTDGKSPLGIARAIEPYQGKWYPRPALTQCGVLFNYAPYEKDCYAAGTVEILLPYPEISSYLKVAIK